MIIVTVGALGAVFAYFVSEEGHVIGPWLSQFFEHSLEPWQISYIIGGILGLLLLLLRASTFESGLFHALKQTEVKKGDFKMLFRNWPTFKKYLACILIGLPVWYVIGIIIALAHNLLPEIGVAGGETVRTKELVLFGYIGLSLGDLISGILSQLLQSRKKVIYINLFAIILFSSVFLFSEQVSVTWLKLMCLILGAATGYWALFVTNASEQFGTNIRSTVTATVPNFVRFGVVPLTLSYEWIVKSGGFEKPHIAAAVITGIVSLALAMWGTYTIKDSFSKDLDYYEEAQ
jgi:MFS family permease